MIESMHRLVWSAALSMLMTGGAPALPPAPANDEPANAVTIGPDVPALVLGTTVLANDSISSTTLPAPANDCDGPDVFYSFTPNATATYRVQLHPWQHAPLRSSDRQFIVYVFDSEGFFLAGAEAPGSARPVSFDVALVASSTYTIGVDHDAGTHDNFEFTLLVDALSGANPDVCGSAVAISSDLPSVVLNDIDAAASDYEFSQEMGRCSVSGSSPTTADGNDHVYVFTPSVSGDYAVELVGGGFDAVVYVDETCPPDFDDGCLGAANHSTSGSSGGKHELVVVTLDAGTDYYIYVDNGSTSNTTGPYALIVDDAFNYEISEIEPNDSFATATPVTTPLNGGQIVGPSDVDWYAVDGSTGDRVYAWANNGGSLNSTLDTDMGFYAADGSTLIEFDDEDSDGADAPIEDLRFIYSTTAPVIAGARMTSDGTHYLRVNAVSATGTVHRYRMHVGVEPGTRDPLAECEPNDTLSAADYTGKHYYSGVIDVEGDVDTYGFEATVGDRVFIAVDGDPERNADGFTSPNDDPRAFHARLVVYDDAGDVLISDIGDSNSIQSGPDYPAQGGYFVARSTGRHYVQVMTQSSLSQVGPEETYNVAVFLNDAAPDLAEDVDPVISLDPDFAGNTIDVEASDNAGGDTGVCAVELADNTNLQLVDLNFTPGDPVINFTVGLVDEQASGFAKLRVTDCAGNAACAIAKIDVNPPICDGFNFSNRSPVSMHGPIHVPDNEPGGPGINGEIEIAESGLITDVNVTITIETIRPPDIDCFLVGPSGTAVELITDRGSSLAFDITEATFDDDAEEIMPILSGDAPYTGTWLPEDPQGLAKLNGEEALGTWKLNVIDDASSAGGGARLVSWSLDLDAGFAGPETFAGTVTDTQGFDCGVASIVLEDAVNVALSFPEGFDPGDTTVEYRIDLIDPSQNGSCTVVVTDLADNTCESEVALDGLPDVTDPTNEGGPTTDRTFGREVQADVPGAVPSGVVSIVDVPVADLVGEVEASITIDTKDVGRIVSLLWHGETFASLVNRVGMDERGSVGLTKDIIDITLDDDAPQEDDAHLEPALGSIEFFGLHQPDGRGEFIGDAIDTDDRDNMLFSLAGEPSSGPWELYVADFREQGASSARSVFRRWSMTIKTPCGAERFVGTTKDVAPGTGICDLSLSGATNLAVSAAFTAGDEVVDYEVVLIDPSQPGNGDLVITDCADNATIVPVDLMAEDSDDALPSVLGSVNPATAEYEGSATDNGAGDSGIFDVSLAPYSENLQIISVDPDPPNGAGEVSFVIGLVDPEANGRGYVRVTDGCGYRRFSLVDIDALIPECTGVVSHTKRYRSGEQLPAPIPDDEGGVVTSGIIVEDEDIISDVDITFNITHPFDDDIELTLLQPTTIQLLSDIGSTGNDFIDTILDDEADAPIPDSSSEAPFTGRYQPEGGPVLSLLDGNSAAGTYSIRVIDDAQYNLGTFESWSVTIESATFPPRYDGRTSDGRLHDMGICSIELLPGAVNAELTVDPFEDGGAIVRYSVEMCNPAVEEATATVRVTDCSGNSCDVPVTLGPFGVPGDLDGDGDADLFDFELVVVCESGPDAEPYACDDPCRPADLDNDGDVDWADAQLFQLVFTGGL